MIHFNRLIYMLTPTTFFSLSYLAFVGMCVLMQKSSIVIFATYSALSVYGYLIFALDKKAAINGGHRMSERWLIVTCLFGGWPGVLFAQVKCRHKTKKQPFKTLMWLAIVANCAIFLVTMSPVGVRSIDSFLRVFEFTIA